MVITDEAGALAAAADGRPPAWILASSSRSEPPSFPGRDPVRPAAALQCAEDVYWAAGITDPRRQIDTAELYVPFSWLEPIWLEAFGLAEEGEGWKMVDDGTTELDGALPVNASGGVLSSNPIGASGLLRFAEAANQVRGRPASTRSTGPRSPSGWPTEPTTSTSRPGRWRARSTRSGRSGRTPARCPAYCWRPVPDLPTEPPVPELPEMQALAERLAAALVGRSLTGVDPLGFTALKTVDPGPDALVGRTVDSVGRHGKYLVITLDDGVTVLVHLSQAGRLDLEAQAKVTRPKGSVVRFRFDDGTGVLVHEHGSQRRAGWWILAPGDDGPLAALGPEPDDEAFAAVLLEGDATRRIHTVLRDQRTLAGVGRGYADDVLNAVGLSPFRSLRSLTPDERRALVDAVRAVLDAALAQERSGRADSRRPDSAGGSPCTAGPGSPVRVRHRTPAGLLRVPRDRLLPHLPDAGPGVGRPPAVAPVALTGRRDRLTRWRWPPGRRAWPPGGRATRPPPVRAGRR